MMLVIDDAKLPPPKPVMAATARNQPNPNSPGFIISIIVSPVGMSSTTAEKIAQLRPPNLAVACVYGIRRQEPTSVAVAAMTNFWSMLMPYSGPMNRAITENRDQIENPTCSQMTDQIRLRLAIAALPLSQATRSSGSQSVIVWSRVSCALRSANAKAPPPMVAGLRGVTAVHRAACSGGCRGRRRHRCRATRDQVWRGRVARIFREVTASSRCPHSVTQAL